MPLYEYRCRTCDDTFELRRSMAEANEPASCPDGHDDVVRLLSVFAGLGGRSEAAGGGVGSAPGTAGPCGASCACYPD